MAAYDNSYELDDIARETGGSYHDVLRIFSERNAAAAAKQREEDRIKYETPLERCPTTGRTLEEEIARDCVRDKVSDEKFYEVHNCMGEMKQYFPGGREGGAR